MSVELIGWLCLASAAGLVCLRHEAEKRRFGSDHYNARRAAERKRAVRLVGGGTVRRVA